MRINAGFPQVSGSGKSQVKPNLPVATEKVNAPQFSLPASPLSSFEKAQQTQGARFSKIEGLDKAVQEAIASYQATQSMAADNPQNYLIGVDTFA